MVVRGQRFLMMRIVPVMAIQALFLGGLAASAQTAGDAGPVPTLRVSTTLIEIPLLIRDRSGELPTPSLPAGSIEVKLGDGAWLRPNFVRQEGRDPIDLAILLDQNSPVSDLSHPLTQALSSFSSLSLTSIDHVSLFVMDCESVRVTSIPADPAQVSDAIKSAVVPPGQSGKHTCRQGGRLWDTLAVVTRTLKQSPSRRVILAITDGKDHGSVITQKDLAELAQSSAVAIFNLDPTENPSSAPRDNGLLPLEGLPLIAESSGGLMLGIESGSLRQRVRTIVTMLRGRYIVQLRLPSDAKPGHLPLSARVTELTSQTYSVRITGNSAPLPNPSEASDTPSQVAKADATPKTEPVQPMAATAVEPASAPAVSAAAVLEEGQREQQPALPAPQPSGETTTAHADEQWAAGADAAMQTSSHKGDSSVPTLKVSTRLTLVDVTVTDAKGHPVHGLTESDFTIKEDGKPQPIKNFEAFGKDKPGAEAVAPPLPPDVYSNQQTSQPTTTVVNILLFDQVSTGISRGLQPSPEALMLAKKAAVQYLNTMPAATQVAVMSMDGAGLHTVQGFTSDANLLLAAVNSVSYQAVPDARWDPDPGGPPPCPAANFQSQQALNALNQTVLFVAGIPGRKNLMWFTPGIPWLTYYPPFSLVPRCVVINYTSQLQQVYGRLTAARVALYPIDARGLYNNPAGEATASGRPRNNPIGFSNAVNADRDSLDATAQATGGKAHYNNDLLGALQEDTATGADYYALSYVPPLSKYDGKYHKIEVSVDRPGVQLEYRRGYTSLDLKVPLRTAAKGDVNSGDSAQPRDPFHAAMDFGGPAATQVTFAVRAVPSPGPSKPGVIGSGVIGTVNPELKGKPLVRYSFAFDLPRDKITLEAQPDGTRKGSFELMVAAYDVQGRVLTSLDEKRSFTLKPDAVTAFLQKPFVVPVEIDLPPGALSVRAGMMDQSSQQMGVVEIPLSVVK